MEMVVEKIFNALLNDEEYTVEDLSKMIKNNWGGDTISELIYQLMEGNKSICNHISDWDFKAIGNMK